ncbi:MAG: TIGR02594 family protein [Phenylobacterium sp.]|uniref:TIGR02594 family protein n=1 Tax=Phenylobacterium sp. TaxID=1871053 RepID=UPI0025D283D8|nr:TIGR02594 family protein [Phenylobacterium sp.]MBA4010939.1 TIGR02594 family protein [Phenylobacterium sp.]
MSEADDQTPARERLDLERERLALEESDRIARRSMDERDYLLRERDMALRESEASLRTRQARWASWSNPLTVALVAAAIGAFGNAAVAYWNGVAAREQERDKAEYARVLEMIKVGDPDKAAENLEMLLRMGLYRDANGDLKRYLDNRQPGEGGYLPVSSGNAGSPAAPSVSAESLEILERGAEQAPWLKVALAERGVQEIPGAAANPRIIEFIASTPEGRGGAIGDEFPWNSQFANWVMKQSGYAGTNSAQAVSWSRWGTPLETAKPGAVVVFTRGDSGGGMVGFYVRDLPDGSVEVLAGNLFNQVTVSKMASSKLIAVRWPMEPVTAPEAGRF